MGRVAGLTARNVAIAASGPVPGSVPKPQYANGVHLSRASPALSMQRSDSPATNGVSGGGPPALPPRSHHKEPPKIPPSLPSSNGEHLRRFSTANHPQANGPDMPPPLPPRGTTPPPSPQSLVYSNSPVTTSLPPPLLRRRSPVPTHASRGGTQGGVITPTTHQRGTSPITTNNPLKVHNSREIREQLQQQLHSMQASSIFPAEGVATEPPPPYPMGTAVNTAPPPPSYSQTLAMRQSPTLSSTSSDYRCADYRRSPAPGTIQGAVVQQQAPGAVLMQAYGAHHATPLPTSPAPSGSSMMSTSSRTSSTLQSSHWSNRQAKTQSPVIMQSVKSTQVQKPVLQTATTLVPDRIGPAGVTNGVMGGKSATSSACSTPTPVCTSAGTGVSLPPPSYEASIQQKHLSKQQVTPSSSPVITHGAHQRPSVITPVPGVSGAGSPMTVPRTMSPCVVDPSNKDPSLPPPPPYPSSKVGHLVNSPKPTGPTAVISTAKVVPSTQKPLLQRKYSPLASETASSSASRSESPISDSQQTISSDNTVSCSPSSFNDPNTITVDSGLGYEGTNSNMSSLMPPPPPPPYKEKTTHISSPKPERRHISPAKEEARKSFIDRCPPQVNIDIFC